MDRRLTAILAADVVGYSRLMGEDEVGTLAHLKACRREVVEPAIAEHHGRMIKLMGDGALVEFASVVDAVQCAAAIQRKMAVREEAVPETKRILFRIGINLGDVIIEADDIYGDGVNIAARLESEAEPGGICISGTAFDHALHKADVGFAALGALRLKNIADPVRAYRVLLDPAQAGKVRTAARRPSKRVLALSGVAILLLVVAAALLEWRWPVASPRPSLAVLPFANLSGDPSQDYFADGITDNLITDLAGLAGLDVIARNSVSVYKGKPLALDDIARDLGVGLVIEGGVQRTGEQVRVTAQLVDVNSGDQLWASRFDRAASDVFALQDEMSRKVAEALGLTLSQSDTTRLARPPTANLEAYDYYLRAVQAAHNGRRASMLEALALFDKAEALDPGFADAFAADARATAYVWQSTFDDVLQSAVARKRAFEKASRALQLDPGMASPYAVLAVMQVVERRYEQALASVQRALSLGPADPQVQMATAYVQLFSGNHAEAAAAIDKALGHDPNLSAPDWFTAGLVFFFSRDTARSIESFERARDNSPGNGDLVTPLALAYVQAGRLDDARAALAEGHRLLEGRDCLAGWRMSFAHFRNPADLAEIVDALQEAGLSEWPYGFTAAETDRLKSEEIRPLVFGRLLKGRIEPNSAALMQIGLDGKAVFRSATQMNSEIVLLRGDLLCEQSENAFGIADCGPVYRHADATGETDYAYVNSSKLFYFSPAD